MSRRLAEFCEGGGYDEDGRLERPNSRLEFLRTQEPLRARLPAPPATVLDVGGGTGVHARWLAEDGYELASELRTAALHDTEILGIEGPGWPLLTAAARPELLDRALRTARLCDGHAELVAASAHLLGCGRATLMR